MLGTNARIIDSQTAQCRPNVRGKRVGPEDEVVIDRRRVEQPAGERANLLAIQRAGEDLRLLRVAVCHDGERKTVEVPILERQELLELVRMVTGTMAVEQPQALLR